jgi:hypothetical protein
MRYYDEVKCSICGTPKNELNYGEVFRYFNSAGVETLAYADAVCPKCVEIAKKGF